MGYISDNNLINYLPLSTTQPRLLLTQCDTNVNDHHHQLITGSSGELGDRKNNLQAAGTSRWNPTPEQITTLEEVYRRGTRTPTTEQIQQIASKLRKYGRIEGKNVFYWFQNHKARERAKRRRPQGDDDDIREQLKDVKDSSSSSGCYRVDQTKSCPSFQHTNPQQQKELVRDNYSKDATWRNLVTSLVTQEPGEININESKHNVNGEEEEEEERRETQTLNLFPVIENQERTDRLTENKNTKASQKCCNYCYYYEFMPLKKN